MEAFWCSTLGMQGHSLQTLPLFRSGGSIMSVSRDAQITAEQNFLSQACTMHLYGCQEVMRIWSFYIRGSQHFLASDRIIKLQFIYIPKIHITLIWCRQGHWSLRPINKCQQRHGFVGIAYYISHSIFMTVKWSLQQTHCSMEHFVLSCTGLVNIMCKSLKNVICITVWWSHKV